MQKRLWLPLGWNLTKPGRRWRESFWCLMFFPLSEAQHSPSQSADMKTQQTDLPPPYLLGLHAHFPSQNQLSLEEPNWCRVLGRVFKRPMCWRLGPHCSTPGETLGKWLPPEGSDLVRGLTRGWVRRDNAFEECVLFPFDSFSVSISLLPSLPFCREVSIFLCHVLPPFLNASPQQCS